jgi:hypothetical protein
MINLPHKEYWLAPERWDAVNARMASQAAVFGIAVNMLMIGMQLALRPGHTGPSLTPLFLLIGFLVFMIGSIVWAQRSFRLPAGEPQPDSNASTGLRS